MAEPIVVLDPLEVADDRQELPLHGVGIRVSHEGIDWGDAQIQAYMSEMARGESPVDFRVANRQIKMTLILAAEADSSVDEAMANLQAKVALLQREGGWLRRGTGVYADVVNATLTLPDRWRDSRGFEVDVGLTLETLPDFYGDEVEEDAVTETTDRELIFMVANVGGNLPGRCRIEVDELSGNAQNGLLGGFRCRHYSDAATAALVYAAADLDPLDAATISGGKVQHLDLPASWTPVLGTNIGGTTFLTHTGSYRLWAAVESADGTDVRVRFVYDVGDLTLPEENPERTVPGTSGEYLLDLGEVRLDEVPVGTHRWQGQIQARGTLGGEDVKVSRLWFQPLDDGAWLLRAPAVQIEGIADSAARDEFNQSTGALAGKTLPIGGTWAGAGDATDFQVTADKELERTATLDTDINTGRYATATPSLASVVVKVDLSGFVNSVYQGVVARYVDTSNWLMATVDRASTGGRTLRVRKRVAGTVTTLTEVDVGQLWSLSTVTTLELVVGAGGVWQAALGLNGASPAPVVGGVDSALATGGALATGKVGIYDALTGGGAARTYDNFLAYSPPGDAVLFGSRSAELSTVGMFRQDATGAAYGPVTETVGELPRIPPSGLEGRPVEVFLKATRGDLDMLPDSGTDDIRAQVFSRPSWLFAPT